MADTPERKSLAANPTAPSQRQQEAVQQPDRLEQIIDRYVDHYETVYDNGYHVPSEEERFRIKDAIMGLLADAEWDEAWGQVIRSVAQPANSTTQNRHALPTKTAMDLCAAAEFLATDGGSMSVDDALRIAATLRELAGAE